MGSSNNNFLNRGVSVQFCLRGFRTKLNIYMEAGIKIIKNGENQTFLTALLKISEGFLSSSDQS